MKKIEVVKVVKATEFDKYEKNLNEVVAELQEQDLEVAVDHAMCQANKGIGYMYSAVVTGRRA